MRQRCFAGCKGEKTPKGRDCTHVLRLNCKERTSHNLGGYIMRLRKTATAMALVLMASGLPAWADIEAAKAFLDSEIGDLSTLDRKSTRLNSSHSQISYA